MSNIENRAILRDKDKGKPYGMKVMAEGYNWHILDVTRICTKSGEAVTSHHIASCWKSSGILCASDVADITKIYGKNIGNSAQDEAVADPLS